MNFSLFQAFCGSSAQISKDNMPSESYENVLIVQGNDFTIKTEKYGKNLAVFRCYDLSANCNYTLTTFKF